MLEGKKEIDLGITTYTPKIEVGAEMYILYAYLKHTNFLLNLMIPNIFILLSQKVKKRMNNVFKDGAENNLY